MATKNKQLGDQWEVSVPNLYVVGNWTVGHFEFVWAKSARGALRIYNALAKEKEWCKARLRDVYPARTINKNPMVTTVGELRELKKQSSKK